MLTEEFYKSSYQQTLAMVESGIPHEKILMYLVEMAEKASGPDTTSSILVLDKDGLLRNAASPGLPSDYLQAIDGLRPHANVGTCAAAAATGTMVITEDFYADNKWAELRHLPLALGFKGAWSMPIMNEEKKVMGTFGTYFREKRVPTPIEMQGIRLLADAAAIVLSRRTAS